MPYNAYIRYVEYLYEVTYGVIWVILNQHFDLDMNVFRLSWTFLVFYIKIPISEPSELRRDGTLCINGKFYFSFFKTFFFVSVCGNKRS